MSEPVAARWRPPAAVLLLALSVLAATGFGVWRLFGAGGSRVEYESAPVTRGDLTDKVAATGTVEATTTVTVGSQVSGIVERVLVDFNSRVRRNQVLATLDPSELEARLAQARAALDAARAGRQSAVAGLADADAGIAEARAQVRRAQAAVAQAESQVMSAEAQRKTAEAGVLRARAEMENALAEYRRFEELQERKLVSASEVDQKRTAYRVAAAGYETALAEKNQAAAAYRQALAAVEAARSDLQAARTRLSAAQAARRSALGQLRAAEAQVRQAEGTLQQAMVDRKRAILRSPIDGVVIQRKVEPGQTVAAAFQAPELFVLAEDLSRMQVRADVNEADIGRVRPGQPVTFRVDAYPERTFEGKVLQVRSAPVETGRENAGAGSVVVYGVLVSAPNPDLLLKPGMTAMVEIAVETRKGVLLVPNRALRFLPPNPPEPEEDRRGEEARPERRERKDGRTGVAWVLGEDGKPERRRLRLGITDGERTEVLAGDLAEGDEVLVDVVTRGEKKRRRMRLVF